MPQPTDQGLWQEGCSCVSGAPSPQVTPASASGGVRKPFVAMELLWSVGRVRRLALFLRGVLKDPNKVNLEEERPVGPQQSWAESCHPPSPQPRATRLQ